MIIDGQLLFSNAQAVTAAAASTNCIDIGEGRNLGEGKPIYVGTVVVTALTDGGSNAGTVVSLYGGTTANASTGQQQLYTLPQIAAAGSGPYFAMVSPAFVAAALAGFYEFLSLYYSPTTANLTGGTISSFLTTDIQGFVAYAKNYTIS